MLGIFVVKIAILCGSVSDPAESSGILDLPLNKDDFTMEHWLSLSKDINGKHTRILSKFRMGCCRNGST